MNFRKIVSLLVLTMLLGGSAMAVEGCFEGPPPPAYGYGASYYPYTPAPAYVAPGPMVYGGDWDEHHRWHDRDWWMANRRPWVESHHHDWLEGRLAHEAHEHEHHEWH